jgi:molecular chaperone DnaK (HSP70)
MGRIYGIDLGTTYSSIAVVDEGGPRILNNAQNHASTPSVVYFEGSPGGAANIVVGQGAKDVAHLYPDRVVSAVKRFMQPRDGEDSAEPDWSVTIDGKAYGPQQISAMILSKVVQDAEATTGEKIQEVVITVPAYFGSVGRKATEQAGAIAGLKVLRVLPEPTAAAIAYGLDQEEDQVVLVYDLGGGTFDVTVVAVKEKQIDVICHGGDHQLGGKDWDDATARYFAESFSAEKGVPASALLDDPEMCQELMLGAETCKERLSSALKVEHKVQFGGDRMVCTLKREKFEELTRDLLERTLTLSDALLATAREKGHQKIHKILLVGGSTWMPQVRDRLERWKAERGLVETEILSKEPHLLVSYGAALMGVKEALKARAQAGGDYGLTPDQAKKLKDTQIFDVSSRSFGVVVLDEGEREKVCNLIMVDDRLPSSRTHEFGVHKDGQEGATIRCIENRERVGPETLIEFEDREIGRTQLSFKRPLRRGDPIEVTFTLREDGLLLVAARDKLTDGQVDAVFSAKGVLSDKEVEAAKVLHRTLQFE